MDITELLAFSAKQGASDLHLSAGLPPMIRVDGDVRRINLPPLDHKQVQALIYDIMNDTQRVDFENTWKPTFPLICLAWRVFGSMRSTRVVVPAPCFAPSPPGS
jgi:Tfp pilus assembly pilus retraction ATPase PilT